MLDPPTGRERRLVATDVTAVIAFQDPDSNPSDPSQPGFFPYRPEDPLCFPVPADTGDHPPEERCTRPFREVTTLYEEQAAFCVPIWIRLLCRRRRSGPSKEVPWA